MKNLSKFRNLSFGVPCLFLTFFIFNEITTNVFTSKENDIALINDLKKTREDELLSRIYKIDRNQELSNTEIIVSPYKIKGSKLPDWWSEKQSYNMSYLLSKALEHYPGLRVKKTKKWDDIILEKEIGESLNKKSNATNFRKIYIRPYIDQYLFNTLRPKKRGVGLIVIAVTNKKCITETFLSSDYQIELNGFSREEEILTEVTSNQLIRTSTGGTSLNLNVGLGALGGGKFKEPPKAQVKKIVYKTVVDAAEGIYCTLLDQEECKEFYKERKPEPLTEVKRRRREKVIDKSC